MKDKDIKLFPFW